MKYIRKIVNIFFNHLYHQVEVIASGSGLSSAYRRLVTLCCYLFEAQYLVSSFCFFADVSAYFELNVIGSKYVYRAAFPGQRVTILLAVFSLLSSFRLFRLLYYRADRLVWSHLHDLVVNNRSGLSLKWTSRQESSCSSNISTADNLPPSQLTGSHSLSSFTALPLKLKIVLSNQLKHYPTLRKGLRIRCALVTAVYEVLMNILLVISIVGTVGTFKSVSKKIITFLQLSFALTTLFATFVWRYVETALYLVVPLSLYLVGAVYGAEYRFLNGQLGRLKSKLKREVEEGQQLLLPLVQHLHNKQQPLSSLNLSRSTSDFRHSHARLTVFLLRLNEHTISPIIAYYLHYNTPYHTNFVSILIFHPNTLRQVISACLPYFSRLLFLGAITLVVARLNHKIALSGHSLATILARKGMLTTFGKSGLQQQQTHRWAHKVNTVWCREQLKLSAYYEMIWRSEKELAFTVGKMGTPMNWKFVSEVRVTVNSYSLTFFTVLIVTVSTALLIFCFLLWQ